MIRRALFASTLLFLAHGEAALAIDAQAGFSKRSAVLEFAQNCELLGSSQLLAVRAGKLQAKGALLRAGFSTGELQKMERIAKLSVAAVDCGNAEALAEIDLVKASHDNWLTLSSLAYPATHRTWTTSRNLDLLKRRWRAMQVLDSKENSLVRFGASSLQGRPSLDLLIENQSPPRSVLLRMRDPDQLENPPSPFLRKLLKLPIDGVAGLAPPTTATQSFFAANRVVAETSLLSAETGVRGTRFGFANDALEAFSQLDPREAVILDMYWSAGLGKPDRHKRLYVEVGDFLAARIFAEAKDKVLEQ
ncbi:MAG: hypothetical protein COA47_06970 [Robiginitomaculum sp.]|nr:MAG: hypothetical protein COA47_06970 [Robiginitomaculum sp.]